MMSKCNLYDISFGYGGSWTGEMFCTYSYHHHRHHPNLHLPPSHHHQQQQLNYLPRFYSREMTIAATDSSYHIPKSVPLRLTHGKSWLPLRVTKVSIGETSSLASTLLRRNDNSSSDSSYGGGSNYDNGRCHGNKVRKNGQIIRCSLPQTAVGSEKENVRESELGATSIEGNQDKMAAESVVTAVGRRKLIPSTRILRLIPSHRSSLLPNTKRHRTQLTAPQQTVKPQAGYVDPVLNCAAEFQQRLTELTALQFETVRWEGQKKARKKQAGS